MSTLTGAVTTRQMRAQASTNSRALTCSPSEYPSDHAIPALVVSIDGRLLDEDLSVR